MEDAGQPSLEVSVVLQKVFEYLDLKNNASDMFNCRLVHSSWKESMDQALERKRLEHWTKWRPYDRSPLVEDEAVIPVLRVVTDKQSPFQGAACPPNFPNFEIPTKSLLVKFEQPLGQYKVVPVTNLFNRIGQQLTSIVFKGISTHASTLHAVLSQLTNLKAMTFANVMIKEDNDDKDFQAVPQLPPLPKLEHFHLVSVDSDPSVFGIGDNAYKWLLRAYAPQLVSLETKTSKFFQYLATGTTSYPNLSRLKLYGEGFFDLPFVPCEKLECPSLERLSLMLLEDYFEWKLLLRFIERFRGTLTHLNIDFDRETSGRLPLRCAVAARRSQGSGVELLPFPKLKTMGSFHPQMFEETELLIQFLNLTPNLETLRMIQCNKGADLGKVSRREKEMCNSGKTQWELRRYRVVCQKLQKGGVYRHSGESKPMEIYDFSFYYDNEGYSCIGTSYSHNDRFLTY